VSWFGNLFEALTTTPFGNVSVSVVTASGTRISTESEG
jgi:hypothetical protein